MPTALVVDDHPAIRLAVGNQLMCDLGFEEIREASNGPDALQVLRRGATDLIIVDLDLPGVAGDAVLEEAASRYPAARVLVLSAMPGAGERAMHGGAHGYVAKQEGLQELMHAIRAVMAGYAVFPVKLLQSIRQTATQGDLLSLLSKRELTVLRFLASGYSNKTISDVLCISNKTVSSHKTSIMAKLGFGSLIELGEFARRHQLLS
ncbi:two component transcriptional regulator, LuxR family [Cupriavidus sp. YR651]|uniref:response regulator transcription factor n=1 Tax=Cupriavidus sp. YR651 TaxID=1855315 RepID=UPI00088E38B9|nr:response regulator transcription factor [Cupriavidus sp. YR651]SDC46042.1 two component transcriptional regulator, LuxR family [Cupriavidus sp. YR651]